MKTIATAAVLMMLTTTAWAGEAEKQKDPANTDEPIVLSEAEMDGVTAGMNIRPLHDRVIVRRAEDDGVIGTYTFQY